MSYLNSNEGPAIYVCPNIYLAQQVCSDAQKFGVPFCVVNRNNEIPDEFRGKPLYAVFTDPDENSDEILKAFRAEYNEESKKLKFETALLGEFVIAPLDFEGEEFSSEFYDELEKAEAVQPLLELLKGKEKKEGNA